MNSRLIENWILLLLKRRGTYLLLMVFTLLSSVGISQESTSRNNDYTLSTEELLKIEAYKQGIEKFYKGGVEGEFEGAAGLKIYYKFFEKKDATKSILISAGRTEAAVKYKELLFDLFQNGYSVYIHDHRGQGQSGRMTEDPNMGYVDNFQFYIDDMKYFYDQFIQPKAYEKNFLIAHSMGGAIGMTYLEQYPEDFEAAAFSSPMLGLKPLVCNIVREFDPEEPKYALGQAKYKDKKSNYRCNKLTGSKTRYERMVDAFTETPEAQLGGATYPWLIRSCDQFEYLFENIEKLQTPFILFSAQKEKIVSSEAHKKFVEQAKVKDKECEIHEIKKAKHELLIEKDEARSETITKSLDFFKQH